MREFVSGFEYFLELKQRHSFDHKNQFSNRVVFHQLIYKHIVIAKQNQYI